MITAQIASIPDRQWLLERVVASLLPQVDQLNIMLNNYPKTPFFCHKPKINYYHLDNSKGDAAKFHGLKNISGYIFTCDDDLIYPPNYVELTLKELERHENRVILSHHGRQMRPKPVNNSYTDRIQAFHWNIEQPKSVQLDIGGTGVMAWHSDTFFPDIDRITKKNMADIWVHGFALEQGVKIYLCPHPGDWIEYLNPPNTIWDRDYPNPQPQTDLYNSF